MIARPPVLITAPAALPVTLDDVKKHLRIDLSIVEDDDELQQKIEAATQALDGYSGALGRALMTQTWAVSTGWHYCDAIRLPLAPVQSIVSVTYLDEDGAEQTVPAADYRLSGDARGSSVVLTEGASWPSTRYRSDGLTVTFVAGYGDAAAVPSDLRLAIKLAVELSYDRPDGAQYEALKGQYDAIVGRYRRWSI